MSIDQVLSSPVISSPGAFDPVRTKTKKSLFISTDIKKESWYGSTESPINRCYSPKAMYCIGNCRDHPSEEVRLTADVVGVYQTLVSYNQAYGHSLLNPDFLVFVKG